MHQWRPERVDIFSVGACPAFPVSVIVSGWIPVFGHSAVLAGRCNDFLVVMILLRSLEICMSHGGSQLLSVNMTVWLTNNFCIKVEGQNISFNKVCTQDEKCGWKFKLRNIVEHIVRRVNWSLFFLATFADFPFNAYLLKLLPPIFPSKL